MTEPICTHCHPTNGRDAFVCDPSWASCPYRPLRRNDPDSAEAAAQLVAEELRYVARRLYADTEDEGYRWLMERVAYWTPPA